MDIEKKKIVIKNPWLSVWLFPEVTVATILQKNPKYGIYFLSAVSGVLQAFNAALVTHVGDMGVVNYEILIVTLFVLGAGIGVANMYLSAYAVYLTGKAPVIKGKATYSQLLTAVAWSNIVAVPLLILFGVQLYMFGVGIFTENGFDLMMKNESTLASFITFLSAFLQVWYIVLFMKLIKFVQGISFRKTLLNMLFMFASLLFIAFGISVVVNIILAFFR